jgi:hypothetical protein
MASETGPRVLQIIADTDASASNLAAVSLHQQLSARGLEVRTLALGAGSRPGLERDVPTMAPSRRSFAARGQFHHEARWSDIVVLHGHRSATVATTPPLRSTRWPVPVVVALWQAPPDGLGRSAVRVLRAADLVVVPDALVERSVDEHVAATSRRCVPVGDDGDPSGPDGAAWAALLRALCP